MRILAVVAHPDDECLGPGATLARHLAAGDEVTIVIATVARHGLMTHGVAQAAAAALGDGAKLRLLGLDYMTLDRDPLRLNSAIEPILTHLRPDVVYTHWIGDLNADHRAVAQAVQVGTRPIWAGGPRRLLAFETPSSSEWTQGGAFQPNVFVDAGATFGRKLAALACYEEEMRSAPHPRSVESVRARAGYWGQVAGLALAEPFVLVREVVR